jgi:hypothetical protein
MLIQRIGLWAAVPAIALAAACARGDAEPRAGDFADADTVAQDTAAAEPPQAQAPRDKAPPIIRGLYLNAYAAGSRTRLPRLLEMAASTEINAFVIDVKDERGIRYPTEIELASELAQSGEVTIRNLSALADTLRAHGIWSIARIVVFKDPILANARPEWSVRQPNGQPWRDRAGNLWVSPWDDRVWDYNISIAEEVARAGFDEIQFDYVRFGEQFRGLPAQVHPRAQGARTDAIAAFLNEAKRRLHPLGAVVAADVFGLSPNEGRDVGIGQQWETLGAIADHLLPMMYPSHYYSTHLPNVPTPDLMPYETVFKSLGMARIRNDALAEVSVRPARVVTWLQAFTATWLRSHQPYGPQQIREQKRAVYAVGYDDWILWHPGSRYEHIIEGLEPTTESRKAASYTPPDDVAARVRQFERQGMDEARERAAEQARGQTVDREAAAAARTGEEEPDG